MISILIRPLFLPFLLFPLTLAVLSQTQHKTKVFHNFDCYNFCHIIMPLIFFFGDWTVFFLLLRSLLPRSFLGLRPTPLSALVSRWMIVAYVDLLFPPCLALPVRFQNCCLYSVGWGRGLELSVLSRRVGSLSLIAYWTRCHDSSLQQLLLDTDTR